MAKKIRTGYFGMSETSECLQWTYEYLVEYVRGAILISIGRGDYKDEISKLIRIIAAWAIYHDNGM